MESVERLEAFWRSFVLAFPDTVEMSGAVVAHCLRIPVPLFNHALNVDVGEDEAEVFLRTVVNHFSSKGLPFACFRVSPLTRPSFASLLGSYGFERELEDSIMVFEGNPSESGLNPDVKVKRITEEEIDVFDKVLIASFEMPTEWKEVADELILELMRRGARNYLAYAEGKPVGTVTLISIKKTGGIFNVGTLKEYRRRGIGTALTVRALLDSFDVGNDLHTLQTERGGNAEKLYQRIGFKVDHTAAFFVKKFHSEASSEARKS